MIWSCLSLMKKHFYLYPSSMGKYIDLYPVISTTLKKKMLWSLPSYLPSWKKFFDFYHLVYHHEKKYFDLYHFGRALAVLQSDGKSTIWKLVYKLIVLLSSQYCVCVFQIQLILADHYIIVLSHKFLLIVDIIVCITSLCFMLQNVNYTFLGLSNSTECASLLDRTLFNKSSCPYKRCSFNGVYQPELTGPFYVRRCYFL